MPREASMDRDMVDVDSPNVAPEKVRDNSFPHAINTSTEAAPEETQEEAYLAAELEAMLDAEAAAEEAQVVAKAFKQAQVVEEEMDTEMTDPQNTACNASFNEEDTEYVPPPATAYGPLPASTDEPPLASSPHFLRSQFKEIEPPTYRNEERDVAVPVSPIQAAASQQFLSQARHHLQEMSWTGQGSLKRIPMPSIPKLKFGKKNDEQEKHNTKRTLAPAGSAKECLVEIFKQVDRVDPAIMGRGRNEK